MDLIGHGPDDTGGFAVAADERCDDLREQLRTCEAVADELRHEARGRRRVPSRR